MAHQITRILLDNLLSTTEDHIIEVKLSTGIVQPVRDVVRYIDLNDEYFFTDRHGHQTYVETVHPKERAAYIRTRPNQTTSDNLLSLPRL